VSLFLLDPLHHHVCADLSFPDARAYALASRPARCTAYHHADIIGLSHLAMGS
jgi:hypothetical protein